jgi:hypothetical protein
MGEDASTFGGLGLVGSLAEDDVSPDGIGVCLDRPRRLRRLRVGVDPHGAEVATEPRLEVASRGFVEGMARRAEDFVNDRRSEGLRPGCIGQRATPKDVLFLVAAARGASLAVLGPRTAGALPLEERTRRRAHRDRRGLGRFDLGG